MFLVDTNVVSELMRARPDPRVRRWADGLPRFTLSVITVEEIQFGLACRPSARLEAWMDEFVARFCAVLPVTVEIAKRSARLRADLRREGRPRTQADMLIAATSAEHRLVLATRNVSDFAGCGIRLLDPFA